MRQRGLLDYKWFRNPPPYYPSSQKTAIDHFQKSIPSNSQVLSYTLVYLRTLILLPGPDSYSSHLYSVRRPAEVLSFGLG